jgi:hypothetical protein
MTSLKPDADRITARLRALKSESWLGQARAWWPDFLFHVTDVQNAARILTSGRLLSRARSEATGAMAFDNASEQVLAQTDPFWKDFVRLYFRPRTPFQYHTEGFRPVGNLTSLQGYCPVPVVFLFDAESLLTRADSSFSDGNLAARNARSGDTAAFFEDLPFTEIYHDGPIPPDQVRSIVYHRHAEVVIPDELDLAALRRVWCRSPAEQETLQWLAPLDTWRTSAARVGSSSRPNLFNRKWTFVERAELSADRISIRLNPSSQTPGPFSARVELFDEASRVSLSWSDARFDSREYGHTLVLDPGLPDPHPRYSVRFLLDERLAFAGSYSGDIEDLLG